MIKSQAVPQCLHCVKANQCLPAVLSRMDLMTLSRLITQGPVLNKGDVLFRPGQAASSLYMIRTGSVRSSRTDDDGDERIVGFALAGDFAGVAALCDDTYSNTLTAMQTTVVCDISVDALKQASASSPALNRFLLRLLSKELRYNRQARLRLAAPRSRIRVARFIVHHMAQLAGRSLSATRIRLPMARWELANHLGLAIESVSRVFSGFRSEGILEVRGREMIIHAPERLYLIAEESLFKRTLDDGEPLAGQALSEVSCLGDSGAGSCRIAANG